MSIAGMPAEITAEMVEKCTFALMGSRQAAKDRLQDPTLPFVIHTVRDGKSKITDDQKQRKAPVLASSRTLAYYKETDTARANLFYAQIYEIYICTELTDTDEIFMTTWLTEAQSARYYLSVTDLVTHLVTGRSENAVLRKTGHNAFLRFVERPGDTEPPTNTGSQSKALRQLIARSVESQSSDDVTDDTDPGGMVSIGQQILSIERKSIIKQPGEPEEPGLV